MRLADVLLAYSEWLDRDGMLKPQPGDDRTHENLVTQFVDDVRPGSPLSSVFEADPDLDEETDKVEDPGPSGHREARWSVSTGRWVDGQTGDPLDMAHLSADPDGRVHVSAHAQEAIDEAKGYEWPLADGDVHRLGGESDDPAENIVAATYTALLNIVQGKMTAPAFSDGSGGLRPPAFDERIRAAEAILGNENRAEVNLNVQGLAVGVGNAGTMTETGRA